MLTELVVLQPSSLCNLNCSYCYVPNRTDGTVMSDDVLEASIRFIFNSSYVVSSRRQPLSLLWHAGEPLAIGIPFYQKALDYIKKYNTNNIKFEMSIQSNATLIDQKWCDFLKSNDIEVAVSVDGPAFIHDKQRVDWRGKGSFQRVMKGIECMVSNKMPLRAICVLKDESLDYPDEIYDFFKTNNFQTLCFNIDEVEGQYAKTSFADNHSAIPVEKAQKFKSFIERIFDRWQKDGRSLNIREFEQTLHTIALKKAKVKAVVPMQDMLAFAIVTINKNGFVSTFSPELASGTPQNVNEFAIGNVLTADKLEDLANSPAFKKQLDQVITGVKKCADTCNYFELCGGGSPSNKFYEHGTFAVAETITCILTKKVIMDVMFERLGKMNCSSSPIN